MPWPFDRPYMALALAAASVVGICAPLLGSFLVQRRMSLFGDGIGHAAFAGVSAGLLFNVHPIAAALVVAGLTAVGTELLRIRGKLSGDLALGILFYSSIAVAVVLASLGGSLNSTMLTFLFGSVLTVSAQEVYVIAGAGLIAVAFVAIFYRELFSIATDEEWASVAGVRTTALSITLSLIVALIVVIAMRVTGLLLVAALMVLPVAAAKTACKSFRSTLLVACGIGLLSVVLGLTVARAFGIAPSGAIVLMSAAQLLVIGVFRRAATASSQR